MDTQTVPWQPGVLLRVGQLSGGVSKIIYFHSFFKALKISLKFTSTPTLIACPRRSVNRRATLKTLPSLEIGENREIQRKQTNTNNSIYTLVLLTLYQCCSPISYNYHLRLALEVFALYPDCLRCKAIHLSIKNKITSCHLSPQSVIFKLDQIKVKGKELLKLTLLTDRHAFLLTLLRRICKYINTVSSLIIFLVFYQLSEKILQILVQM